MTLECKWDFFVAVNPVNIWKLAQHMDGGPGLAITNTQR